MAKQRPGILKVKGRLGDQTFVSSPTYGDIARANRGTYTEVTINDVLTANKNRTPLLNNTSGPVFRALDIYTKKTRDKQLWQTMLSLLRASDATDPFKLLDQFLKLELNPEHPYQAVFMKPPQIIISAHGDDLHVFYDPGREHPIFKEGVTSYRYSLLAIFPTLKDFMPPKKKKGAKANMEKEEKIISANELLTSDWISTSKKSKPINFQFLMPAGTTHVVLCFLIQAREGLYEIPSAWANRAAILVVQDI